MSGYNVVEKREGEMELWAKFLILQKIISVR